MCPTSIDSPSASPAWQHIKSGILGLLEDSPISTEPLIATLFPPLLPTGRASNQCLTFEIPPDLEPFDFSVPPGFNKLSSQGTKLQSSTKLQAKTRHLRGASQTVRTPPGFASAARTNHGSTTTNLPKNSTHPLLHGTKQVHFPIDQNVACQIRPRPGDTPNDSHCITQTTPVCTRKHALETHSEKNSIKSTLGSCKQKRRSVQAEVSAQVLNIGSNGDVDPELPPQSFHKDNCIHIESVNNIRTLKQMHSGRKHTRSEQTDIPVEPLRKRPRVLDDAKPKSKTQSTRRVRWTKEEDSVLLEQLKVLGSQWALIAPKLPGRSADAIRLRWKRALSHQHQAIIL